MSAAYELYRVDCVKAKLAVANSANIYPARVLILPSAAGVLTNVEIKLTKIKARYKKTIGFETILKWLRCVKRMIVGGMNSV